MDVRLSDSALCRLCAADNPQGSPIFVVDEDGPNLSELINSYLPLKVYDDGMYSRTICPGCNIQLEATVEFFNLIINGQRELREVLLQEKGKDAKLLAKSIGVDSCYSEENSISLQMAGLDKPKRKRGRPKKILKLNNESKVIAPDPKQTLREETSVELVGKRRRKAPERLKETVQGKELERIFREEGVIDGEESDGDKSEKPPEAESLDGPALNEVIGHMQTADGTPIGEPIRINKGKGRGRPKGPTRSNKQQCIICGTEFTCLGRYMSHVAQHGPVTYQCAQCSATFPTRLLFNEHQEQSAHSGQNIIKGEVEQEDKIEESSIITAAVKDEMQESAPTLHQMLSETTPIPKRVATNNQPEPVLDQVQVGSTEDTYIVHVRSSVDNYSKTTSPDNNYSEIIASDLECIEVENLGEPSMMADEISDLFEQKEKENAPNNTNEVTLESAIYNSENSKPKESSKNPQGKLKCPHCDKLFSSKQSKSMHIKALHSMERPYVCKTCGATFPYPRSLTLHMASHRKMQLGHKGYACDLCGKVLNHPSSVVYHKEAEHTGQKFECIKCGKVFKHRQLLQRHQLVHTQDRPYSCELCPATFKAKANLINHQALHTGVKKFKCGLCKQMFAHKTSLTLHMRWHNGQKPYVCGVCSKTFAQRGNLIEHQRTHTGEKPYRCDQCPRTFTTSSQYRLHLRRHSGDRPFACTLCGKRFITNEAWRSHMRRELGQLEHHCSVCGRGFAERWALFKHQRCHTGEKPHACPHCPRTFADSSNLTKHKKTHRSSLLVQDNTRTAAAVRPVPTSNTPEPEEKVIYVTYSVDGSGDAPTFHILDPEQAARLDESKVLTTCSLYEGDSLLVDDEQTELAAHASGADIAESALYMEQEMDGLMMQPQMSVTDEDGNPVQLTMQDGTTIEITSADGKSIQVLTEDGQTIPFELNHYKDREEAGESLDAAGGTGVRMLALDDPALAHYFTIV